MRMGVLYICVCFLWFLSSLLVECCLDTVLVWWCGCVLGQSEDLAVFCLAQVSYSNQLESKITNTEDERTTEY